MVLSDSKVTVKANPANEPIYRAYPLKTSFSEPQFKGGRNRLWNATPKPRP